MRIFDYKPSPESAYRELLHYAAFAILAFELQPEHLETICRTAKKDYTGNFTKNLKPQIIFGRRDHVFGILASPTAKGLQGKPADPTKKTWTVADYSTWLENGKTHAAFVEWYKPAPRGIAKLDTLRKAPDSRHITEWKIAVNEIIDRKKRSAFGDLIRDFPEEFEKFRAGMEKVRQSDYPPTSFAELVAAVDRIAQELVEVHLSGVS